MGKFQSIGWINAMNTAVEQWQELEQKALRGGGISKIERQYAQGKQTARDRLATLLDPNSFTEIDRLAISPFLEEKAYTDGVITGFGRVDGRPVAIYAQDFTIKGGSLGKRHADKICKVMDMAAKIGCPIIGIIDSGGARIDEGIHALAGYGQIFRRNSMYSGVVPQISVILGPCAGGAAYSPGLTDIVFMTEGISQMFITGPQVIEEAVHQTVTKEALGGASVHTTLSGVAHVPCADEADCFAKLKVLLSYLPASYMDESAFAPASYAQHDYEGQVELRRDERPSSTDRLADRVPANFNQGYDMHTVIESLTDTNSWFELQPGFAANILTGFALMDGMVIGIVANQPMVKAGCIDIDASCKAARFIRFCDSFSIPIVSLVDTPGYLPGVEQEHDGIIRHGAKLLYAYATATVPKITLVLRKAFGGAYVVMGSKELGADFNFAWPTAHIAVLGARAAVTILHGKALATAAASEREALEAAYAQEFLNPLTAAQYGYIDAVIAPHETRQQLVQALHITKDKVERLPARKHGNMPL
jgi:acetyl-CoA/propionyl-CoA carboxylase